MLFFEKSLSRIVLLFCGLLFCVVSVAQNKIVKLKSGISVSGQIQVQNDDIIVIRTAQGRVFQYPRSEVLEVQEESVVEQKDSIRSKRVGLRIQVNSGLALPPSSATYGIGAGLQVGAVDLFNRHIYLGGGLGIDMVSFDGNKFFLPLTATLSVPLMQTEHAPFVQLDGGYAFAVRNSLRGGAHFAFHLGYQYRFENQKSIHLSLFAKIQQATWQYTETIENNNYTYPMRSVIPQAGLMLAVVL